MNYPLIFIIVSMLVIAVTSAKPYSTEDFHDYLICAREKVNDLAAEYNCKNIWKRHSQEYFNAVAHFEECVDEPEDTIERYILF